MTQRYIARCSRCGGETAPQDTPEEAHATLKRHFEGEHRKRRSDRRSGIRFTDLPRNR